MEKLQVDNDRYSLHSPDSLKYVTDKALPILDEKIGEYKIFFGINEYRRIEIFFFDNKEKFREYVYSIRGERESLPAYAAGVYDEGKIITYTPPNLIINSPWYRNALYNAPHELFHIMYLEIILKNDESKRIVWYDEGMAMLLSGEYDWLNDEEQFKDYFNEVKENTKISPNMNELEHGHTFKNADYDGYQLSYLIVRYLKDTLSKDEFRSLLGDFDRIREYGEKGVEEMFDYFSKKFTKRI